MEMDKEDFQEVQAKEPMKEMNEEQFLKELYLFMRKRDTPIERIPHLGFKQIDLFLMFKTVNDFGGYSQVTSQQLWKQVYNTLGGNPRSTSAATCTRRHYEKLLLPYECHTKGIMLSAVPQHQPKPFHYVTYGKNEDCDLRPLKRRMLLPMHQAPHHLQPDPHGSLFPLPLHYPHFFPPAHTVLPPYVPISSAVMRPHSPPAPKKQFPIAPTLLNSIDRGTEPLEHLRSLSEWYKTSSGLVQQPLNLSKKISPREPRCFPVSSFSPPSSSKNPKFLNKPSPLYSTLQAGAPKKEGSETPEGDPGEGGSTYSYPVKARESGRESSSPVYTLSSGSDKEGSEMPRKAKSPKADTTVRAKEDREASADSKALSFSHILPGDPQEKDSKMEIEIPLSVFHHWLKLYGPSALAHKAKEASLSAQEEYLRQKNLSNTEGFNANLTFQLNTQNSAQDLRLRNAPSPIPTAQAPANHHNPSQTHLASYSLPLGGILRNAASRDVYPFDLPDTNKAYNSKSPTIWDAHDKEDQPPLTPVKSDGSPHRVHPDFAPKLCTEDAQGARQKSEAGSSAVLMVNSNSLLHLTTEEVLKLKKMISSSS